MGCGASSSRGSRHAAGTAYTYPVDEGLHRDFWTERPVEGESLQSLMKLEFYKCCRSVAGEDADEPGTFGRATQQLSIVMRARLLHDINGDTDQFEPPEQLETEVEASAERVREWFNDVAADNYNRRSMDEAQADDNRLPDFSRPPPPSVSRASPANASKTSASEFVLLQTSTWCHSAYDTDAASETNRFVRSYAADLNSVDDDPCTPSTLGCSHSPSSVVASPSSISLQAPPKRRENPVPLRLEALKLHDTIIAEKKSHR
jgi:hypothetical protein